MFAFDRGKAGEKYAKQFVKRAKVLGWKATAAQPPEKHGIKLDWNEILIRDVLNEETLEQCRYQGKMLIAETALEKALLIHQHRLDNEFPFEFRHCLYWYKFDSIKFDKAFQNQADDQTAEQKLAHANAEATSIQLLTQCYPQVLYFQKNLTTQESWYYMKVDFPDSDESEKDTFTGKELACSHDFKKRLLHVAPGALFTGDNYQLNAYLRQAFYQLKRVKVMDYVGYNSDYKCYVFDNLAVKKGKVFQLNSDDYFDINRLCIKSKKPVSVILNPNLSDFQTEWLDQLWQAFEERGLVALAFWFGSFFEQQIRQRYGSFGFLEISGDPGTGKTSLLEFLWKLAGRNSYEGFDPSKANPVAIYRNMAQVSNLPVVFIEGDRADEKDFKHKRFHWDELKSVFDGRSIRSIGVCNNGNETYEPPFRGVVVIAQNAEVQASPAILNVLFSCGL